MPRVVIADDSVFTRKMIRKLLEEINFDIIGEANNGLDAVSKTARFKPDLLIMDLMMPKMDGLTALKKIMEENPTRVLLISGFGSEYVDLAFTALDAGALAFVPKGTNTEDDSYDFKNELIQKAKICLKANLKRKSYKFDSPTAQARFDVAQRKAKFARKKTFMHKDNLIIIGASTGGPGVVKEIISRLRPPFPPIILVQHLPVGFSKAFSVRLDAISALKVIEAENDMRLKTNSVYIAPGGKHLVLNSKDKLHLYDGDRVNGVIPSLDPTLISASYYFGSNLNVVILTGMGSDGLAGTRYSKQNGARIIIQDEDSSIIYGMPKAIADAELADYSSNPKNIVRYLNQHLSTN
ncbi:MAG: chemotaxis-specific protein-glutamate methyltransferase CheB [Candidatus Hodarchaeales archaeon]|jgi:two-component system chemotaxis response regulator CheB